MIFFNNLLKKLDVPLHRKKHISGKERKKLWWESRRELYCDLAFSNWQLAWENNQLLNFLRLSCWWFAQDTLVPCWYWSVVEWDRYMWYVILTVWSHLNACKKRLTFGKHLVNKIAKKQPILYITYREVSCRQNVGKAAKPTTPHLPPSFCTKVLIWNS